LAVLNGNESVKSSCHLVCVILLGIRSFRLDAHTDIFFSKCAWLPADRQSRWAACNESQFWRHGTIVTISPRTAARWSQGQPQGHGQKFCPWAV